jgi:SpoVK/Ycf46/Vps4 family AAA+-type ATPase
MAKPDRDELRRALEANPGDHELRLRLAAELLEAGLPEEALLHAQLVLDSDPASLHAVVAAHDAASGLGDALRADGYRKLRDALVGIGSPLQPGPVEPQTNGVIPETAAELIAAFAASDPPEGLDIVDIEEPVITFDDVAGMESVKRRLELWFLSQVENPELAKAFGATGRGGVLLYGPPGCGKTHIGRALAGEMGARFYALGLDDILDMWIGHNEKNIHGVFEAARAAAPCVLFFDALDTVGRKRGKLRRLLLDEIQNVDAGRDQVYIVGATSHPWDMGSALMRPGRFDRSVLVLPPNLAARKTILSLHLRGKPVNGVDLDILAARTERFSSADLGLVVASATELAMSQSLGFGSVVPLGPHHVDDALEMLRPSTGAWFDHATEFAASRNGDGCFQDLIAYMQQADR